MKKTLLLPLFLIFITSCVESITMEPPATVQDIQTEQKLIFLSNGPANDFAPEVIIEASRSLFYAMEVNYYNLKLRSENLESFTREFKKDPNANQYADEILNSPMFDEVFVSNKKSANSKTFSDTKIDYKEVSNIMNSKEVSKNTRKYFKEFAQSMEKTKEKANKQSDKKLTEPFRDEILKFEDKVIKDVSLTKQEKEIIFSYTIPTRDNLEGIYKSISTLSASSKVECFFCKFVNAIVTIVVTVAAMAVIGVAVAAIGGAAAIVGAVVGAALGLIVGIATVADNQYCVVVIDHGQNIQNGNMGFLDIYLGQC